jgi:hypothetical protein
MAGAQEPIPLPGQDTASEKNFEWDWGGYFEDTFNVEYLKAEDRGVVLNAARGRLNASVKYKSLFDFGMSAVGILYAGRTEIDIGSYFPEAERERLVPGAGDLFQYEIDNRLFFQELFGTIYLPSFRLRAGRHKFYSGTGYAFNPIDLFNRKDPLDPTYEVDGLDAILAAVELPRQTEVEVVARFADDFDHTDYQVKLGTYARGWDLGLQFTYFLNERMDWETLNTEDALGALAEGADIDAFVYRSRWSFVAGEFAGELGSLGIHGEGGYVFVEEPQGVGTLERASKDHERFLLGVDTTLESQWYFLLEYMRLGQGADGRGFGSIDLNDRMAYFTGATLAIGKDTIFGRVSYPLTDLAEISLNTIVNANDPSVILNPWLVYDLRPGVKLTLALYLPVGDETGANGTYGVGGFARVKIFF